MELTARREWREPFGEDVRERTGPKASFAGAAAAIFGGVRLRTVEAAPSLIAAPLIEAAARGDI